MKAWNMIPKVLYIFCHGYFSPKEVRFLQMLMKTAPEEIQCYHWGDMDYGGIQIFLYNEKEYFSKSDSMEDGRSLL